MSEEWEISESERLEEASRRRRKAIIEVVVAVVIMVVLTALAAIPSLTATRRTAYNARAKGTLRSIGTCQLAFRDSEGNGNYGTFDDLKLQRYIAEGYSQNNIVDPYSLHWVISESGNSTNEAGDALIDQFLVYAIPDPGSPKHLRTYAITEDQIVREYDPDHGNKFNDVLTWDPIK